jgi:hypothetical protein
MATNHDPDGLTIEAITALQREVNDELRREGYPVQPAQQAFVAVRPAPAHRLRADHSSPRTEGSTTGSLPTGDGPAWSPQRSSGHRGRSADDVASSSDSGDL